MDTLKEYIRQTLGDLQQSLDTVLDGLNQDEIAWQPSDTLNSIGLILFHTSRTEDFFIQELVRKQTQIWEQEKWFEKFGMPAPERGRHYTEEQVRSFVSPDIGLLKDYFKSVRESTLEYIKGIDEEEYSRVVVTPRGERPVSGFLSTIITHAGQHIGEMSYLRGLQRGLNK
jgi:hypothetical protein